MEIIAYCPKNELLTLGRSESWKKCALDGCYDKSSQSWTNSRREQNTLRRRERKRELLWFGFRVRVWPRKIGSVFILYGATMYVGNYCWNYRNRRCSLRINCIRSKFSGRNVSKVLQEFVTLSRKRGHVNKACQNLKETKYTHSEVVAPVFWARSVFSAWLSNFFMPSLYRFN